MSTGINHTALLSVGVIAAAIVAVIACVVVTMTTRTAGIHVRRNASTLQTTTRATTKASSPAVLTTLRTIMWNATMKRTGGDVTHLRIP